MGRLGAPRVETSCQCRHRGPCACAGVLAVTHWGKPFTFSTGLANTRVRLHFCVCQAALVSIEAQLTCQQSQVALLQQQEQHMAQLAKAASRATAPGMSCHWTLIGHALSCWDI